MRFKPTGLPAWWVQRVSAVYMLAFLVFAFAALAVQPRPAHAQWASWVARPAVSVASVVFLASLLAHMWVGLRDVLLDYARPARLRSVLLATLAAVLLAMAMWVVLIFIRLHT